MEFLGQGIGQQHDTLRLLNQRTGRNQDALMILG